MRFAVVLAFLIIASPACADWNGFYVGAHAAAAFGKANPSFSGSGALAAYRSSETLSTNGELGGGHIGFGTQFGQWYFGIEADADFGNVHGARLFNGKDGMSAKGGFISSGRARLGYASEQFLVYATAGLAISDYEYHDDVPSNGKIITFKENAVSKGGVVGGGLEWRISDELALRGEALYYMFNDQDFSNSRTLTMKGDASTTLVRVGLSFRP